jgi:hypothetical protein
MALDPNLVSFAWALADDQPLDSATRDRLARVLESREELFAYVFTLPSFATKHPDIAELILKLAEDLGGRAATRRTSVGDLPVVAELIRELRQEILGTLSMHAEGNEKVASVDDTAQQVTNLMQGRQARNLSEERWILSPPRQEKPAASSKPEEPTSH